MRFIIGFFGAIFSAITIGLVFAALGVGGLIFMYSRGLPDHETLANYTPPTISRIYSRQGMIVDEFAAERRLFVPAEDIPDLVGHFLTAMASEGLESKNLTPAAMAVLQRYSWPGNVRELEYTIERAVLLGKGERISEADLPMELLAASTKEISLGTALSKRYTLRELEMEYIKRVLETTGGNKTEAAIILGVDRTTLYRKLEEDKTMTPGK